MDRFTLERVETQSAGACGRQAELQVAGPAEALVAGTTVPKAALQEASRETGGTPSLIFEILYAALGSLDLILQVLRATKRF